MKVCTHLHVCQVKKTSYFYLDQGYSYCTEKDLKNTTKFS